MEELPIQVQNQANKFKCDKCGACCRAVNCKFLSGNICSIYNKRPTVCNIEKGYNLNKEHFKNKESWYEANKKACLVLQKGGI